MPSGEWAFPEINDRFEELRNKRRRVAAGSDPKEEKIAELRNEIERLREQNRLLALEINRIGQQILEERERADRMAVYERQNASLREEISRIHAGGRTSLKVVASMKLNQLSGRERGEENLAKVRRYLAGLKATGQSLPLQDGRAEHHRHCRSFGRAPECLLHQCGREATVGRVYRWPRWQAQEPPTGLARAERQLDIKERRILQLEQQLASVKAETEELRKRLAAAEQKLVRYRVIEEESLQAGRRVIP